MNNKEINALATDIVFLIGDLIEEKIDYAKNPNNFMISSDVQDRLVENFEELFKSVTKPKPSQKK